jgi:hypothetical protein
MLHASRVQQAGVPVIRRFSGGGTVIVDADTQLVSFIFGVDAAPDVPAFPAPLMKWSERFYAGVFEEQRDFRLRENGTRHAQKRRAACRFALTRASALAQTMCSASASLAATRSPSSRGAGCTTPPSSGTSSPHTWRCCSTRRACPPTARRGAGGRGSQAWLTC